MLLSVFFFLPWPFDRLLVKTPRDRRASTAGVSGRGPAHAQVRILVFSERLRRTFLTSLLFSLIVENDFLCAHDTERYVERMPNLARNPSEYSCEGHARRLWRRENTVNWSRGVTRKETPRHGQADRTERVEKRFVRYRNFSRVPCWALC